MFLLGAITVKVFTVSPATVAGRIGHVPIILDGHRIVVGYDLVDHGVELDLGAEEGQDYREASSDERLNQLWLLDPGILEKSSESPSHVGLSVLNLDISKVP